MISFTPDGESTPAQAPGSTDDLDACVITSPTRVLVVEDEDKLRQGVARFLRGSGLDVVTAESIAAAREAWTPMKADMLLCDVHLPDGSGFDLIPEILHEDPLTAVIVISGANDARLVRQALLYGVMDYITKPFSLEDLLTVVRRALDRRHNALEQQRIQDAVREQVAHRTEELQREHLRLRTLSIGIAETLINAMEAKNIYLKGHSQRVAELAASIADEMGLDEDAVEHVRMAGRLHDVGKIGIREEVLDKPEQLTSEEYAHVKEHVRIGLDILAPLTHLGDVLEFIRDHHERLDGKGYPRGIGGDAVSIGGRIIAAADTFDALTSSRAYREPMPHAQALLYMAGFVGTALYPDVYAALSRVVSRGRALVFLDAELGVPNSDLELTVGAPPALGGGNVVSSSSSETA